MHKQLLDNTQIYIVSSGPHIIFSAVATKRKNSEQNFVLIQANTTCREQMTKQNYFTNTLVLNFSNWYYILIQMLSITKPGIT